MDVGRARWLRLIRERYTRRGSFTFTYSLDTTTPDASEVFKSIIKAGQQAGYYFRFFEKDGVFHFVPTSIRNLTGVQSAYSPILDRRITFPEGKRSLMAFVVEVLKEAEKDRDVNLGLGRAPLNLSLKTQISDGANGESARELLSKALRKGELTISLESTVPAEA